MKIQHEKTGAKRWKRNFPLMVLIVSLGILGFAVFWFSRESRRLNDEYKFQRNQIGLQDKFEDLFGYIKSAESDVRGYVISNNVKFVKRFDVLIDIVSVKYRELQQSQDPEGDPVKTQLFSDFDRILNEKIRFMKELKDLCDRGERVKAMELIGTEKGLRLTDSLISLYEQSIADLRRSSEESGLVSEKYRNQVNDIVYLGIAAAILMILVSFYFLKKEIRISRLISERLRESEEQYRILIEHLPEGIYTCDKSGYIRLFNKAIVNLWGYQPQIGIDQWHQSLKLFRPDGSELPHEQAPTALALEQKKPVHGQELIIQRKDGTIRHILPYPTPVFDSQGNLTGVVCINIDITDKREREIMIRNSEEKYRSIIDQASDAILVYNVDGEIKEFNNGICNLSGFSRNEFSSLKLADFLDDGDLTPPGNYSSIMEGGAITLYRNLICKNGTRLVLEVTTKVLPDGNIMAVGRDITERKRLEEKLRESEKKYRSFFEQSADAIFLFDETGQFKDVNEVAMNLLGYSKEEFLQLSIYDLPVKEELVHDPIILDDINQSTSLIRKRRLRKKGNSLVDVEVHTKRLPDNCFLSVVRDIGERLRAEKAATESHQKLNSLINTIDGIVWEADANTFEFTYVSNKAEEILGYPVENWIREKSFWADHIHPEDKDWVVNFCQTSTQKKRAHEFEYRMISKDSSIIWLRDIVTVILENEKPVQLRGIMIDITSQKTAEKLIRESEEIRSSIMSASLDAIICINTKGEITVWNPMATSIFGWTEKEMLGNSLTDTIIPPQYRASHKAGMKRYLETGQGPVLNKTIEITGMNRQGVEFPIALSIVPIKLGSEEIFCSFIQDITKRKNAEIEILQKNKQLTLLTEYIHKAREEERKIMAREIHDELGQQLTVMKMDVSWLNEQLGDREDKIRKRIEELDQVLSATVKTVRRLAHELRPSILDDMGLEAAIEWHLSEFEKRSGIKTEFNYKQDGLALTEDIKTGLFRITQESLTNVARYAKASRVIVWLLKKDNQVVLSVKDDGAGFELDKLSTKKTLGILGMRERCSILGGTFEIETGEGKGTHITVAVPLS